MIESENLLTASLYINNQLLSRGLLRDGHNIDFANPGDTGGELAETMGRVMSVVNDLILRRDRDAEHRESLSTTLRALRAESLRQANDIQHLREKNAEAQRKVSLGEASEAALRLQLRTAETGTHKLREEAARAKTLVAQTRAACANEVRKRDRQIEALKRAVSDAGRARGSTRNPAVTTIQVSGEIGGDDDQGTPRGGTANDGYDLRMETNAFLAELAKGLSEENETLLSLIRRASQRLKEMSGYDKEDATSLSAAAAAADGHVVSLPTSPEELSAEIDSVLSHLRTILTNPSFVPIEEVVMREDEINRLRDGWDKMESRWKEAVHLIDGWRRRMQLDGRPVNVEELKMGLRLSPVRVREVEETSLGLGSRLPAVQEEAEEHSSILVQERSPAESLRLVPASDDEDEDEDEYDGEDGGDGWDQDAEREIIQDVVRDVDDGNDGEQGASDTESSIFEDGVDVGELETDEPNVQVLQQSVMIDSSPLPPPPQLSALRDSHSAANRGASSGQAGQDDEAPNMVREKNTWEATEQTPSPSLRQAAKPQQKLRTAAAEAAAATVALRRPPQSPARSAQQVGQSRPTSADSNASSAESVVLVKPTEASAPKPSVAPAAKGHHPSRSQQQRRPRPPPPPPTTTTKQQNHGRAGSVQKTTKRPAKPAARTTANGRSKPSGPRPESEGTSTQKNNSSAKPWRTPSAAAAATATATTPLDPSSSSDQSVHCSAATATNSYQSSTTITTTTDPAAAAAALAPSPSASRSPRRVNSRLPLPRTGTAAGAGSASVNNNSYNGVLPPPQQSPLTMATIAAKLAASEREADAARVRAKLKAARLGRRASLAPPEAPSADASTGAALGNTIGGDSGGEAPSRSAVRTATSSRSPGEEQEREAALEPVKKEARSSGSSGRGCDDEGAAYYTNGSDFGRGVDVSPRKQPRKREWRATKAASRRRSTLSPWELESLILGGTNAAPPTPGR